MCFKKNPKPFIKPVGTIDNGKVAALLQELSDTAYYFPPDNKTKIYKLEDVKNSTEADEVSSIKFIAEEHDCDDFAAELYGKFAGLVWTNSHAMNWFIDDKETLWLIEPQTKKVSRQLEGWQGNDIRFFLGR